jgi:hypothetical protein
MSTLYVERKEVAEPASDANTMVEKRENDTENESLQTLEAEGQLPEDQLSPDDYPKGLQFFFILLALILSIFMVALDLVYLPLSSNSKTPANYFYRQSSQPRSQRSQMTSTASPRSGGTAQPSS